MFILEIHRAGEFLDHVGWFPTRALAVAKARDLQYEGELVLVHPDGHEEQLGAVYPSTTSVQRPPFTGWQQAA